MRLAFLHGLNKGANFSICPTCWLLYFPWLEKRVPGWDSKDGLSRWSDGDPLCYGTCAGKRSGGQSIGRFFRSNEMTALRTMNHFLQKKMEDDVQWTGMENWNMLTPVFNFSSNLLTFVLPDAWRVLSSERGAIQATEAKRGVCIRLRTRNFQECVRNLFPVVASSLTKRS